MRGVTRSSAFLLVLLLVAFPAFNGFFVALSPPRLRLRGNLRSSQARALCSSQRPFVCMSMEERTVAETVVTHNDGDLFHDRQHVVTVFKSCPTRYGQMAYRTITNQHAESHGDMGNIGGQNRAQSGQVGCLDSTLDVVFVHGLGTDGSNCQPPPEAVSEVGGWIGRRWLIPDMIGHGNSEMSADTYAYKMESQAQAIVDMLVCEGTQRCAVIAHSMGGPVAVNVVELCSARGISVDLLLYCEANNSPIIYYQGGGHRMHWDAGREATHADDKAVAAFTFTPAQQIVRAVPFVTTAAYLFNPQPLDDMVATIYSALYNWDIAQMPLFEAEVAVFGFVSWIVLFSGMHLVLGDDTAKASRFDGELPHKPFEWAEPKNFQLWFNPTASYLGSIWLYLQIHEKPPLPELPPTFGVLAVETICGIILYDLCFMPIHYLMHNLKIGAVRKIHGYHHRSGNTTLNALETVQHSYLDGFLQVFVNIMVQQISPFGGPKHVMSRLLHNLGVTYLLSESHSGYRDLPWMSHNLFPEIFGGAPRHEAHHHNGRIYYQQFFKYIDDFFGFTDIEGDENETIKNGVELRRQQQQNKVLTATSLSIEGDEISKMAVEVEEKEGIVAIVSTV